MLYGYSNVLYFVCWATVVLLNSMKGFSLFHFINLGLIAL